MNHLLNSKKLLLLIFFLSISIQQIQLHASDFGRSFARKAETNTSIAGQFLIISFVIGNIIAWSMGAHPRFYDQTPYTQDEQEYIQELQQEIQSYPDEAEAQKELGIIHFRHNDLDSASEALNSALEVEPNHAESLAVWGANEAKSAGAMWDFTFGLWKLSRIDDAVEGLNRAIELEPDNINVRLFHLNTLGELENRRDSLHYAFLDEQWYIEKNESNPKYLPEDVQLEFLDALTRLYLVKFKIADEENRDKNHQTALSYFNQLKQLPIDDEKKEERIQKIENKFLNQNIQFKTTE
ncbi:MAG: hypothetical protein HOD92_03505 [Deltaproteobacteria bacterium]|jgi:tetratricopeptide (TPR) repeat protein|nr:hypothetical protein [Deltaproteobacteria bacterium]